MLLCFRGVREVRSEGTGELVWRELIDDIVVRQPSAVRSKEDPVDGPLEGCIVHAID